MLLGQAAVGVRRNAARFQECAGHLRTHRGSLLPSSPDKLAWLSGKFSNNHHIIGDISMTDMLESH